MISNKSFFNNSKAVPVDQFIENVLYNKKVGYYSSKTPFGKKGDFLTAPGISNLFSEIIGIWLISTWYTLGRPKNFNIVELGPGDGSLTKILLKIFQKFSTFNQATNIFLYEKSNLLKKLQKKNINNLKVKWIKNFTSIKKGPVIFFGNEFFDAIPIKQFKNDKGSLFEKNYTINQDYKIKEVFKKASDSNVKIVKSFKTLKNLRFVELPKLGLDELTKIIKKIKKSSGCILMIDYGYLKSNNQSTLQSVMGHKKNNLLNNLGKADITSHVNFPLLKEFFKKKKLKIKNIISQKEFLENMGILKRAEIISNKMKFSEQSNLYLRLKRLLNPRLMGNLFKVILAHKTNFNNFAGFK